MFGLFCAALLASAPEAEPPAAPNNALFLGPAVGVGAGVALIPPVPYALPWFELEAGYDRALGKTPFLALRADLSLGPGPDGGTVIGGYQALGELGGAWFDTGTWRLSSYGRAGVISFTLVPLPLVGVGHTLRLTPYESESFRWSNGLELNTDWVVLPAFSGSGWASFEWRKGAFTTGLRFKLAWGASLWKGLGVSAGARLSAGLEF